MASVANAVATPLEVYRKTIYHPDCDWIDGEVAVTIGDVRGTRRSGSEKPAVKGVAVGVDRLCLRVAEALGRADDWDAAFTLMEP